MLTAKSLLLEPIGLKMVSEDEKQRERRSVSIGQLAFMWAVYCGEWCAVSLHIST